jgi:hypothetical protein
MRVRFFGVLLVALTVCAGAVENDTRPHLRPKPEPPPGRRLKLALGTLFLPAQLDRQDRIPLLVHFHGDTWLPEVAAANTGVAAISIYAGEGSGTYARAFADTRRFGALVREAEAKAGVTFASIALTAWSAGYGGIREILAVPEYYQRVDSTLLIDGLHAGYRGMPGSPGSDLEPEHLAVFARFARDAVAGKKRMIITHSEIFPGTFASTTESADCLINLLGLERRTMIRRGPMGIQQLTEASAGRFLVLGYAGDSAPDHVDQLYALPVFSKLLFD